MSMCSNSGSGGAPVPTATTVAPPEVVIVLPTGLATGDCVDPMGRYIICDVDAWFDGFEAGIVFGRVYASNESEYMEATPDPLASRFTLVSTTSPRKRWRHLRLTFSPPSSTSTICEDRVASGPQTPAFPINKVKVWAGRYGVWAAPVVKQFSGACCTPSIPAPAPAQPADVALASAVAAPAPPPPVPSTAIAVAASGGPNPILIYENLPVNDVFSGTQLLLPGGASLFAKRIEISARHVSWRSQENLVTSCLGTRQIAGSPLWRFPNAFERSIVINQEASGHQMVLSQKSSRPQQMTLDPTRPIHAVINDTWFGGDDNVGSFDLRIRVLE